MRRYLQYSLTPLALIFIFLALVISNRLSWITPAGLLFFPVELFVLGLLLLMPGRSGITVRWLTSIILAVGIIFRIADISAYQIFSRPFNPVFDAYLLVYGVHLLETTIGVVGAYAVAALLVLLAAGILVVSFLALRRYQNWLWQSPKAAAGFLALGLLIWIGLFVAGSPRASYWFYAQLSAQVRNTVTSIADLRSFREVVNEDVYASVPGDSLFQRLRGKDVLIIFVESYGRTVLDKSEYSTYVRPALNQATEALAQAGFNSRSAFLTSPTVGGISWLAHGTALSGLWIDSQVRYDSLMMSDRPSLVRLFNRAGWRTLGVMPAITMNWPEGQYFGYDHILSAPELDYKGKPFNYVTMPDQFTLARLHALELAPEQRKPVMAEIALISSHAPWTPIPHLIDWQQVGDGSIFNEQATAGDPAEVVWQDKDRVIRQFRESIEYVVATIVSYATTYGDENLVILVLGDHQPMPYVTDDTENRDVPVHLIARDPAVLNAVTHWNWTAGMLPADDAPVWRMDQLRDRFIEAFSEPIDR